jgi:hypothetical protein
VGINIGNLNIGEAQAGDWLQGQPGLQKETLSQKKEKKVKEGSNEGKKPWVNTHST